MLQSIPIFIVLVSGVSNSDFEILEKKFWMFLWSKDGKSQGMAMVNWEELCKSREHRGVGLCQLTTFHEAVMGRQIIKALKYPDSDRAVTTNSKFKHEWTIWKMKNMHNCSHSWNAIRKYLDIIRGGLIKEIREYKWVCWMAPGWIFFLWIVHHIL